MLLIAPHQHRVGVLLHGVDCLLIDDAPSAFPACKGGGLGGIDWRGPIHRGAGVFYAGHIAHDDGSLRVILIGPKDTRGGGKARVDALLGKPLAVGIFQPAGIDIGTIAPLVDLCGLCDVDGGAFRCPLVFRFGLVSLFGLASRDPYCGQGEKYK